MKSRMPLVPFDMMNAGKPAAALLWEHLKQATLLEFPDQDKSYFDIIMRFRRHRTALIALMIRHALALWKRWHDDRGTNFQTARDALADMRRPERL